MSEDHWTRLLGVRDGLIHALISVKSVRANMTGPAGAYLPPERHTRRRKAVMSKIAELDKVAALIQRQLDDVKDTLARREPFP